MPSKYIVTNESTNQDTETERSWVASTSFNQPHIFVSQPCVITGRSLLALSACVDQVIGL